MLEHTKNSDREVYDIIIEEKIRQENNIEMIASESIAPLEIMEIQGSIFTNKTLEGYPDARFQAGSEQADKLEILGVERAKTLFNADHANIQVNSGTQANYAVFATVLEPKDKVLSMRLDQGGHLTHGSPANFLSKVYDFHFYGVDPETEMIDYEKLEETANDISPKLIIAGASSYPRLIDYQRIAEIAHSVNAYFMVDMAHISGLVAAKVIPSPVPHADFVTSSTSKTFAGPRSGFILCKSKYASILDAGVFPGSMSSMQLTTMAAKAFSFKAALNKEYIDLMNTILSNTKTLSRELISLGFRLVSGGSETHLILVDLRPKNITGLQMQEALDSIGITVNKNQIPFDDESPSITSGIRIGLTSVSQRGFKEKEIKLIAKIMNSVALNVDDEEVLSLCRQEVNKLTSQFRLYPTNSFD